MLTRSLAACSAALLATLSLSACSGSSDTGSSDTDGAASTSPSATCPVTVADPWVKAADSGMTAAFGVLSNPSPEAVTIAAASSPAVPRMELHEVVESGGQMVMQAVEAGFAVPAGGSLTLEPGGYHLMLMDLPQPIEPGDEVGFTLTCTTGGSVTFTAQAKTFAGAGETYASPSPSPGMDRDGSGSPTPAS